LINNRHDTSDKYSKRATLKLSLSDQ